jgi:tetratricopeptide (TPR) repeat protein
MSFFGSAGIGFRLLPWEFAQAPGWNTVGTTNAWAIWFGLAFLLAFARAQYDPALSKRFRAAHWVAAGALFLGMLFIGYWGAFLGIVIGVAVLAAAGAREKPAREYAGNIMPIGTIVASIALMLAVSGIVPVSLPRLNAPPEVVPVASASWNIAKATAADSMKNFLIGSGPATYQYQYALHRSPDLNRTPFWNIRFPQGFNALFTHLVSWGVIGTLLFLLFLAACVVDALRAVRGRKPDSMRAALAAGGAYLLLMFFIYPQNFVLYFLFFAIMGILLGLSAAQGSVPARQFGRSLAIMLAILAIGGAEYAVLRRYVAGVQFARGMELINAEGGVEKGLPLLAAGADLDPKNDAYLGILARAFLARADAVARSATGAEPSDEVRDKARVAVQAAIAASNRAVAVNPRNAMNFMVQAQIYEAVMPADQHAAQGAFDAYAAAALLEPNNPLIPAALGRAHLAYAAIVPEEKEAKHYAAAQGAFEAALALKPDYADVLYFLGVVSDMQGDPTGARARFAQVLALNPDNGEIMAIIANIDAGRPAFVDASVGKPALGSESEPPPLKDMPANPAARPR